MAAQEEGEALWTGLEPASPFHTPNYHQEKQGLKVSFSADSDTVQVLAGRELSAFHSQGRSELCSLGADHHPLSHSSSNIQVDSPQLQGLYLLRHDSGSRATSNSSFIPSLQAMKLKRQTGPNLDSLDARLCLYTGYPNSIHYLQTANMHITGCITGCFSQNCN